MVNLDDVNGNLADLNDFKYADADLGDSGGSSVVLGLLLLRRPPDEDGGISTDELRAAFDGSGSANKGNEFWEEVMQQVD